MARLSRFNQNMLFNVLLRSSFEAFGHGILAFLLTQVFKLAYAHTTDGQAKFDEYAHIIIVISVLLFTQLVEFLYQTASESSSPSNVKQSQTPNQLAERIIADQIRIKKLNDDNSSMRSKALKSDNQLAQLKNENASLRASAKKTKQDIAFQIKANQNANASLKAKTQEVNVTRQAAKQSLAELQRTHRQKQDLQFEIEMLRCTVPTSNSAQSTEGFPQPFVVVLIDGDAYDFSRIHFEQKMIPAGAHAANNIRREVQQHLMASQDKVPIHSRIMTRLLLNEHNYNALSYDFARTFTETSTLFDVLNCGRGKERVDSRIFEIFNLFITNPYCHRIFLAATRDAGFARLLEPYMADKAATEKIVLVHPGYMIREIEELGLNNQEWPNVFKKKHRPYSAAHNDVMVKKLREADKEAHQRAIDRQIIEGFTRAGVLKIPDWLARKTSTLSRVKEELEHQVEEEVEVIIDDLD